MTLAIALAGLTLTATAAGEEKIDARVLDAFQKEFATAREISWTSGRNYYQASFYYNEQYVSAYYNNEGELIGLTRNISPVDLPLALQSDLKKNHSDYWISNLFEVSNENGTAYYITLEDAENSVVMKSANGKSWENYKKIKKS